MTRPSSIDTTLIERFLRTQHFRHAATPKNYAGTLRNFAAFVSKHGEGAAPTVPIMQQWLKERSLKWPAHILYHRTFLVERYLKWLQEQGVIASSPFTELHRPERVNDFATPGDVNLVCGRRVHWSVSSPQVAG